MRHLKYRQILCDKLVELSQLINPFQMMLLFAKLVSKLVICVIQNFVQVEREVSGFVHAGTALMLMTIMDSRI